MQFACLSTVITKDNSLDLLKGFIKGATGTCDAFCAGSIYGIYNGWSEKEIFKFASMVAVCNLSQADSISGLKSKEETLEFCSLFNRKRVEGEKMSEKFKTQYDYMRESESKEEDAFYPEEWEDNRRRSKKEEYFDFYNDIKLTPKDDW